MKQFRLPDPPPELRTRILELAKASEESTQTSSSTANDSSGRHWGTFIVAGACFLMVGVLWMILATSFSRNPAPIQAERVSNGANSPHAGSTLGQDSKEQSPPVRKLSDDANERLLKNLSTAANDLHRLAEDPASSPYSVKCKVRKVADGTQFLVDLKLLAGGKVLHEPTVSVVPGQWSTVWVGEKTRGWVFESKKDEEPVVREVEFIESGSVIAVRCDAAKDGKIDLKLKSYYFLQSAMVWSIKEDIQVASGEERIFTTRVTLNFRDQDVRAVKHVVETTEVESDGEGNEQEIQKRLETFRVTIKVLLPTGEMKKLI